jgi:hypothetical protein
MTIGFGWLEEPKTLPAAKSPTVADRLVGWGERRAGE